MTICLAAVSFMVVFPLSGNADIVGEATILNTGENYSTTGGYYWNYPLGYVTWTGAVYDGAGPSTGYNTWSLNYTASINGGPSDWDVYCTEVQMDNPATTTSYTLLSIDGTLDNFGLDAEAYIASAWLADNHGYTSGGDPSQSDKALAQLVMWEIIQDGLDQFDLYGGSFRSADRTDWNNGAGTNYNAPALDMYNAMVAATDDLTTFSGIGDWVLAVNPTIEAGQNVEIAYAQNYLIHNPIPEPSTLVLVGLGLCGLLVMRKRRS